ncbi:Fic family protein [Halovivax gelatinilyticus]|uniref:Fic family protein n=1 Tax=Halovivax gelatinilyticus TaxID=2961597 RepID=UPI0020CA83A3|nr:Fic family protein [Halovivax gelatinilyticus]
MADDTLPDRAPGSYIPYGARPYYLPEPLPPEAEIEVDRDLREALEGAIYELGRLEGVSEETTNTTTNPIVYTSLVRREAVESVLIEGAKIELEDLFRHETLDNVEVTKDVQEGLNYESAVIEGAGRVDQTGAITIELLDELHGQLLQGTRHDGETIGAFRRQPVHLPPPETLADPFIPPAPGRITELMDDLIEYVQTGGPYHKLLDVGIVHYQFETIHPYSDGNGRLGRLLITLQLIEQGYLSKPYLYPSAYFNEHKVEYVTRMRAVSEEGAWEPWLRFFVDGIRRQAADAVERTDELRALRRTYEAKYGHEKTAADRLAMRLFQHPYVTTNEVAEFLDVTSQTARNAITELEAQDVLEETTGKQRYQEFKAVDIFEILTRSFE